MRILSIIGTRPEAVKMAPVIKQLESTGAVSSYVCVTAQHRNLLDQVLSVFEITPDFDLNLMRANQSLFELTSEVLTNLEPLLKRLNPDWILVQGDTTTAMAASLAAFYQKIPLGHIEAGLRTRDKYQPYPEEINRRITIIIADFHFAPTESARDNLLREGIAGNRVLVTGNPVIDAIQSVSQMPEPAQIAELLASFNLSSPLNQQIPAQRMVLVTAHRRENFGAQIENICYALDRLADMYQGTVKFVYPVHPNPNIQEPVYRLLSQNENIFLVPPLA